MGELKKLAMMLHNAGIPFEYRSILGENDQICYPSSDNRVSDVVCHPYSYGYKEGLLEQMGLLDEKEIGDEVEGYLTAETVFKRWKEHYKENKND